MGPLWGDGCSWKTQTCASVLPWDGVGHWSHKQPHFTLPAPASLSEPAGDCAFPMVKRLCQRAQENRSQGGEGEGSGKFVLI